MDFDLVPHERMPSREIGSEPQANGDILDITQEYLKKMWLLMRSKASGANKSAIAALGLSILALFLVGGIFTSVLVYIVVLLATLIPQIKGDQGKKEIAARAARTTLMFLPLLIISLVGVYVAPLVGAAAIVIGALQFQGKGAADKKRSISMWAIAFSTVAIMLSMMLIGVSMIGEPTDPVSFTASHSAPPQETPPPSLPVLNPPDYVDKEGLAIYKELKQKGYEVKVVFEDKALTDKYGDATNLFDSLYKGKTAAPPAEGLIVGGLSQSSRDVKLTVVVRSETETPPTSAGDSGTTPEDAVVPPADSDGYNPSYP